VGASDEDEDEETGDEDATMEEAAVESDRRASPSPQPQKPSRPAVTETYDSAPVVGSALQRNQDGTVKAPIVRPLSKRTKQVWINLSQSLASLTTGTAILGTEKSGHARTRI